MEKYGVTKEDQSLESNIPKELMSGTMCIGHATCGGKETKVYLSNDTYYSLLPLVLIGPMGSGKSTLLGNLAKSAVENGECVILPDFTGNCELSKEIASVFNENQVLRIKSDNIGNLQGMGWNEIPNSENPIKRYTMSRRKTALITTLVNVANNNEDGLTARMGRVLESASMIVCLKNGPIKDIFSVLNKHTIRHAYLSSIDNVHKEDMADYIECLQELDEKDENGTVVGTNVHLISGVIDRLHRLKTNAYVEAMIKKGTENNINLVEEIEKSQLIIIEMPQKMFLTNKEKDMYVTYWITKIRTALQFRDEQAESRKTKVNLIIDDIHSASNAQAYLQEIMFSSVQFNTKIIVSCYYLNHLNKIGRELRSANASYMLLSGCNRRNFMEIRDELQPYTEEDLLKLKRYHSLNRIKTASEDEHITFVTKLPRPLSKSLRLSDQGNNA